MKLTEIAHIALVIILIISIVACAPSFNTDISPTVSSTVGFLHSATDYPTVSFTPTRSPCPPPSVSLITTVPNCTKAPQVTHTQQTHPTKTAVQVTISATTVLTTTVLPLENTTSPTPQITATPALTVPLPHPTDTPRQTENTQVTAPQTTLELSKEPTEVPTAEPTATSTLTLDITEQPTASAEPETSQVPTCTYNFKWAVMPAYFQEHLGTELYVDMLKVLDCLSGGLDTVVLDNTATDEQWDTLRRAIQICFIPWRLLYDPLYLDGGPFIFDAHTKVLTVRYNLDGCGKDEYIKKLDEFSQKVSLIMSGISDISNKEQTAREIFSIICASVKYKDDGKLTVYEAITENIGFCQTFSQMYRYFLWQADIPCYLCSGALNHEWNIIKINENYFYADITWQITGNKQDTYYFGFCTDALKVCGYGDSSKIYVSDELASVQIGQISNQYCTICNKHN